MPPPRQCGARMEPCRARPVPFCFHGFWLPPETKLRVLVEAVPWRWLFRKVFTAWCSTGWFTSPSKYSPGRVKAASRRLPAGEKCGASSITALASLFRDNHDPVLGAGHRAPHEEQVAIAVDLDHGQSQLGMPPVA